MKRILEITVTAVDQHNETVTVNCLDEQRQREIDATVNFDEGSITLHDDNGDELARSQMHLIAMIATALQDDDYDSLKVDQTFLVEW